MNLSIGELAVRSGTKVSTIRFYEAIGFIPRAVRSQGRQRRFSNDAIERLRLIRHARKSGFDTPEIRFLLALFDQSETSCQGIIDLAADLIDRIEALIRQLKQLQRTLQDGMAACPRCRVANCAIMGNLTR